MEQQQCPICMLYLLPGMNLEEHLRTHPKDMIIKALLTVKPELLKPLPGNDVSNVYFTSISDFNTSTPFYQQQQQQQNHQNSNIGNYTVTKRNPNVLYSSNNNNTSNNDVNQRPTFRLALEPSHNSNNQQHQSQPTTPTFVTQQQKSAIESSPCSSRNQNESNNLFGNSINNKAGIRCVQSTERQNILIVNTSSSTQYVHQQSMARQKKMHQLQQQQQQHSPIELQPVLVENLGDAMKNSISLVPRYTSEKYSGPPPPYSTAISSCTNTINDNTSQIIDLTQKIHQHQQPTTSSSSLSSTTTSSQSSSTSSSSTSGIVTKGKNANKMQHSDVNNSRVMIRSTPKTILQYGHSDDGHFVLSTEHINRHHPLTQTTATKTSTEVINQYEAIEIMDDDEENGNNYNIKFVGMANMDFDDKYEVDEEEYMCPNTSQEETPEMQFELIEEEEVEVDQQQPPAPQTPPTTGTDDCQFSFLIDPNSSNKKPAAGLKVLSNVKLTSSDSLPTSIKDILYQYSQEAAEKESAKKAQEAMEVAVNKSIKPEVIIKEIEQKFNNLIECTETLNLSKEKEEFVTSTPGTSVIRKATFDTINEISVHTSPVIDDAMPSTSGTSSFGAVTPRTTTNNTSSNFVFNNSINNRLKVNKQPKKLVVKLKKPLTVETEKKFMDEPVNVQKSIKAEVVVLDEEEDDDDDSVKLNDSNQMEDLPLLVELQEDVVNEIIVEPPIPTTSSLYESPCKEERPAEHFTVTFLSEHNLEPEHRITVTPDGNQDSSTNQSILCMESEPEIIKRERVAIDVVVKTELTISTNSSRSSNSSSSSGSDVTPGPSRLNDTSKTPRKNFMYQNERARFSPPFTPNITEYLQSFGAASSSSAHVTTTATSSVSNDVHQKKEEPDEMPTISWIKSSLLIKSTDRTSGSSRYTPSFDDNRSNYTEMDGLNNKTSSNSLSGGSGDLRAPSIDSLNIRTDEKMPARGEISEQESNGEIEQPWHPYFQLQAYPSSYDMSTAQECWNLSKADSQNACDSNNIQNVIVNFPPLSSQDEDIKTPDLLKSIMQTVTPKTETNAVPSIIINEEASGSSNNIIVKKARKFRCPECSKIFPKLRARNRHIDSEHTDPQNQRRAKKAKRTVTATQTLKSIKDSQLQSTSAFASTSSSAMVNWTAAIAGDVNPGDHDVKVLDLIKSEPSTSAAVLVKNEMSRILMSNTTGSIKMEMDRLIGEPSTSTATSADTHMCALGVKLRRTYMCAKCNEQFPRLKLLDKHFHIHPAECTLCQKTFNSWSTFSLHLKHHLNIRVHACRFCPKRFVQRQRLVEHERVHTGSMPIKCPDCDERFRRYSNMLHHRARVHLNKRSKQEDFVCDCGEIYPTKAKLEWHQETHENRPKPCPYCRERFTHRNSLTRHIRLSHTDKYVFVKSKAVSCPICSCTYLPSSIKAHMMTHSIATNKEFSCAICSKQFSTKWNLKQHNWTHANRSTKPFQCNICPSAFVRETDYTTHMNAHRSIKPYTCNYCGRQFVRKYNWLRHTREHEREKKFVCTTCGKKFHRAYYLTEHKRVHTGERPFACNICGKTSATKTNHNKHIRIHHARDPLTAEG